MAGRGTRFTDISPDIPKPLIKLHGQPLVRWVVENLRFKNDQKYIFVCLEEHVKKFNLDELFGSWNINYKIVTVPVVTEGAACSALAAVSSLDDSELIVANSDQYILYDKNLFLETARKYNACIMTMKASGPKWSYVKIDQNGFITEVKEKQEISSTGTVGIYYFESSLTFQKAVQDMINANERYNNEFYLAPCYNFIIKDVKKVGQFNIGSVGKEMIGLGTSEDFLKFQETPLARQLSKEIFL